MQYDTVSRRVYNTMRSSVDFRKTAYGDLLKSHSDRFRDGLTLTLTLGRLQKMTGVIFQLGDYTLNFRTENKSEIRIQLSLKLF